MNVRKPIDYSAMFEALDTLMSADLPQMELYCEIGRLVSGGPEKGTAVAAAEYLRATFPDVSGFSPRNLRRMREFYRSYESSPKVLVQAMTIGWTQNVVILEAELTLQERAWYIRAVQRFEWSKLELQRKIAAGAHLEIALDFTDEMCYTENKNSAMERTANEENPLYLPREHLPPPNGRVRDEGPGEKSGAGDGISHRICRYQHRGNRQSGLSPSPPQAGGSWDQLRRKDLQAAHRRRLRSIRSPDRNGPGQYPECEPGLRRRFSGKAPPADGVCWSPRFRGCRPLVHG